MVTAGDTTELERSGRRRRRAGGALVGAAIAAGGLWFLWPDDGADDASSEPSATVEDTMLPGDEAEPFHYLREITERAGTRIEVANPDDSPHTFTSDDGLFDSGVVEGGATAELPSLPEGRYPYHCEIHPALTGELVVTD